MKKGFTLIELLATIVVISMLALIAIPTVNTIINSAQKHGFEQNILGIMKVIQLDREDSGLVGSDETMEYDISAENNSITYNGDPLNVHFSGKINGSGKIYVNSYGDMLVTYSNNKWCAYKNYSDTVITVEDGACDDVENLKCSSSNITINVSPSNDVWSQKKKINISFGKGNSCSKVYYKLPGDEDYKLYSGSFAVSSTETINLKATSEVSEDVEFTSSVSKIDSTAPNSVSVTTSRNESSIKITAVATDSESGIYGFQFSSDNGSTWSEAQAANAQGLTATKEYTMPATIDGSYTIKARAINNAYHNTDAKIANLETGAKESESISPCVIPTFTVSPSLETWSQSKTVTIGEVAGYDVYYSIDGGDNFVAGNSVTVNENSSVIAKLTNGTNTCTATQTVNHIDNSNPSLSFVSAVATSKTVNITFSASDSESSVTTTCVYGEDDSYELTGTVIGNVCTISNLRNDIEYLYKLEATDEAGLSTSIEGTTSALAFSTISITESPENEYTHVSKTITISGTTDGARLQYQLGNTEGEWIDYSDPFVIENNTTIYARFYDGINESQPASLTVTSIIKEASQVYYNNPDYTDGDITVQEALEHLYEVFS